MQIAKIPSGAQRARHEPAHAQPRTPTARALLLLAGCVFGASRASAAEAAGSQAAQQFPPAAAPLFAGPTLDRAAFVRAVLDRNPTLEAARHGWRAALARERQVGALEDPMLELGLAPLSIGSKEAPVGFEAALSQKLPWFGKRALARAASAAEAEGVKYDYEALRRELALTAVTLYEQYFVATRALEINAAHVELMQAMRDAALAQFASGRGSAQDALQAEAELAHMEHDALVLASEREITVAQMNELLHRSPELPLPPPPQQLRPPPAFGAASGRQAQNPTRPDIAALEQRAKAQQARAQGAERERYPDLTLSTSYSSMWDMPAHRWMVGLSLALPIQTGVRAGAAEEARALRAQLEQEAARLSAAARTQAFVARKQLDESQHVLRLYETRLLPVARQRIEAARAGFVTAQNPFLAVIDAERALRVLELEYQSARAQQVARRAELDRALGVVPGLDWEEGRP